MNDKEALFNPIGEKVFRIRGQYVMLDRDLAGLYGVETKYLNRQVSRNIERFEGEDFMFRLTLAEHEEILRCQNVTLRHGEHTKYLPNAFTDNGLAMLSSVLNSPLAIRVNRQLMRYFNSMRKLESKNDDFRKYVEANFKFIHEKMKKNDISFEAIFSLLDSYKVRQDLPYKSIGKIGFKSEKAEPKQIKSKTRNKKLL